MAVYSIKDLEKLSGIKAHTIRIWEKRYGMFEPKRTDTNIRYYMDDDLKKLLNIALLNRYGYKISKISEMSDEEIASKVTEVSEEINEYDAQLDALTISMIEIDEIKFDRIVNQNIASIGFEQTMLDVIYPFLDKLGVLWFTGSINAAQESFMANLIRQKIYVAIDKLHLDFNEDPTTVLLYMPEGENQELSMLFIHYMLKARNFRVVNLGQNITFDDLRDAHRIIRPDYILTMINEPRHRGTIQDYVSRISDFFNETKVIFSGYQVIQQNVQSARNYVILKSLDEVLQYMEVETTETMPGESLKRKSNN